MRKSHYITILVAVVVIAGLYWGANTVPPKKDTPATPAAAAAGRATTASIASTDSLLDAADRAVPEHAATDIATLKQKLGNAASDEQKADINKQIAEQWHEHKQFAAAGYYYNEYAKLDNSEKSLNFAGRYNLDLLHNAQSAEVQAWAAQNAINNFEQSLKLNPDNDTVKMALASSYIDGTAQPMQGIQLLLGITREKPDNVPANLMLGQLSVRSGQHEKAIDRFEKVLAVEPNNTEALYFLAEVYKNTGNKEKAIELLEKCKAIINNPQFSKDIDDYINSFK